jgi:hypothetical protein
LGPTPRSRAVADHDVEVGRERFLSTERLRVERRGADEVESAVVPRAGSWVAEDAREGRPATLARRGVVVDDDARDGGLELNQLHCEARNQQPASRSASCAIEYARTYVRQRSVACSGDSSSRRARIDSDEPHNPKIDRFETAFARRYFPGRVFVTASSRRDCLGYGGAPALSVPGRPSCVIAKIATDASR